MKTTATTVEELAGAPVTSVGDHDTPSAFRAERERRLELDERLALVGIYAGGGEAAEPATRPALEDQPSEERPIRGDAPVVHGLGTPIAA